MEPNKLVQAFIRWRDAEMGYCCYDLGSTMTHWGKKEIKYERKRGDGSILSLVRNEMFDKADKYVCARERAWRSYCSIRDSVSYHIEPLHDEQIQKQ